MGIYVNRTLNMKQIAAIGFDMDYTLVRYDSEAFEEMTYKEIVKKLLEKGYPDAIGALKFKINLAIRGLVIDKPHGNILKLSTYSKVKHAYHGLHEMDFKTQQKIYQNLVIDLNDTDRYSIVDTTFSIAYCVLYMQLVDMKDSQPDLNLPDYKTLEQDLIEALDISHRDGSLKSQVKKNVKKFIVHDAGIVEALERFKRHGKKLWVITNSDYEYSKLLLDYSINPYLKEHKHWSELFNLVVTAASKPRFFTDKMPLLQIDPATGLMRNHHGKIEDGIYQGGNAQTIQKNAGLSGEQILYLGDHIYGDVLQIKKTCNWRTALVIDELISEVEALDKSATLTDQINDLMAEKVDLEQKLDDLFDKEIEKGKKPDKTKVQAHFKKIEGVDKKIGKLIRSHSQFFNPYWGETMRAGVEPSRLAGQIEKYACIYMAKISDFTDYSPRTYYRPRKKTLPHELA
ncbi:HAD-IG family 5'-nucleotidase [Peredibacter starrii]|uniref:HAD-IG family 5'-nucleotidase n=2 Tax=Peredibacter starrii TaxID=28202 RepID=A0AAX4HJ65_9BACT|nr:HAD-IG family 5'-nucleotidase [Peredibacter starrii]WPU63278.1 HAD-IG family 5'-nucleotidase [Peredibacter starrii]